MAHIRNSFGHGRSVWHASEGQEIGDAAGRAMLDIMKQVEAAAKAYRRIESVTECW